MGGVTGRITKMAFAKFATNSWGAAASVTKGVYFESDGGLKYAPAIVDDETFGQVFKQVSDRGDIAPVEVDWTQPARYNDWSYVLEALAMGSPATVAISTSVTGQTTSWLHVFDLADVIDGLGATFAFDKSLYVDEVTSAKISGWSLEVGEGGVFKQAFHVLGSAPTNVSATNINSTVAGASYPALGNRIFRRQATFRMNLQSAGGLAAGDAVQYETIKLDFRRPQDFAHVGGSDSIIEPADTGTPVFTMEIGYPRMTTVSANSLYAGLRDSTVFKADLTCLGSYINSTDQYKVLYQAPHVQLRDFEAPVVGLNQVKPKAIFDLRLATSSPTGMAFVRPFRLTRIMTNSLGGFVA